MPTKRLRCFVAMAFDHDDTDAIFDNVFAMVLKDFKVVRVDRKEHNRNIDREIMDELSRCDFAVADLTYARPSVYFEAGYAESRVPVIYTARSDHLRPRVDDEYGNFRVHFDLQMRNIIRWANADDASFPERLRKRVAHVTKPLQRNAEAAEALAVARNVFASLSRDTQTSALFNDARTRLLRHRFRPLEPGTDPPEPYVRRLGTHLRLVSVVVPKDRASATELRRFINMSHYFALNDGVPKLPFKRSGRLIESVSDHIVVASIDSISSASIRRVFPSATASADGRSFQLLPRTRPAGAALTRKRPGRDEEWEPHVLPQSIHLLTGVASLGEFAAAFDGLLDDLTLGTQS